MEILTGQKLFKYAIVQTLIEGLQRDLLVAFVDVVDRDMDREGEELADKPWVEAKDELEHASWVGGDNVGGDRGGIGSFCSPLSLLSSALISESLGGDSGSLELLFSSLMFEDRRQQSLTRKTGCRRDGDKTKRDGGERWSRSAGRTSAPFDTVRRCSSPGRSASANLG